MSETDPQAVLMAKIAAMETELASLRKQDKPSGPDSASVLAELRRNPTAAMAKYGIDRDYVTKVLVAEALGDKAPPELRAMAALGPQVAAQSELAAEMAALRQRLDASEKESARRTTLESTKNLAADKTKYPHLSKALANDPSLIEDEIRTAGVSASEAASAVEARLARAAKALGVTPPPSQENGNTATGADTGATTTSTKVTAHMGGDPPQIPQGKAKSGFTEDDKAALRDEIVRNMERGVYNNPLHPYRTT